MNDYTFKKIQHDLKTPISILFDLLPNATGSVKERTMAVKALSSIQMILDSISKRDEVKSTETTYLPYLFQSLHENLKIIAEKKRVILDMTIDQEEVNTSVYAPSAKLFRSLQNLIGNAIEATPNGHTVKVRYTSLLGRTTIKIIDEGCGMPAEVIQNIYQGGLTNKPIEGQGLGLRSSFEELIKYGKFEILPSQAGTTIVITVKTVRSIPSITHPLNSVPAKRIVLLSSAQPARRAAKINP
jgi:signal transduction histidine kinase